MSMLRMEMIMAKTMPVFDELVKMLRAEAGGFAVLTEIPNSKAKEKKPGFHLYSKGEVEVMGRRQQMYFAGVIQQKSTVGFYMMCVYCDPKGFALSPALKKKMTGKSCFHFKALTPELRDEVAGLLKAGKAFYKKAGWM